MVNEGKWLINIVEDGIWDSSEEFDTKEEAIAYGKLEFEGIYEEENGEEFNSELYKKEFFVGKIERFVPSVCVDSVVERIAENAYDEVGDVAESYLERISKEEYNSLEERLNQALNEWLDKTKNHPTFYTIVNTEKVEI
ncbi:hypothetical protein [Radiobacillus sp. PE A8.2]|uniref:hypothetical protein n=1 Tax=Radiobacillus sp. PE A8.2 TaxID=3380349 RepID=UPI00388E92D7